jgi:hypothetical protein
MTMKKAIIRGMLGFPMGIFLSISITILISLSLGTGEYNPVVPTLIDVTKSELNAVILQYILSGILGFMFAAGSTVFEVEQFSLVKQVVIHFFISVFTMLPIAYILRWMDHSIGGIVSYVGVFLIIYVVIWMIQYMSWKKKIHEINKKLEEK